MDELEIKRLEKLAYWRPEPADDKGNPGYKLKTMSEADKEARREFIKIKLKGFDDRYTDIELDKMTFTFCKDKTVIVEHADLTESVILNADKLKSERSASRRAACNIPEAYANKTSNDFDFQIYGEKYKSTVDGVKDTANTFLRNFPEYHERGYGLYICSHTKGSGKTLLACVLLNELITRYQASVFFAPVNDLIDIASDFTPDGKKLYIRARDAQVLCIDDFGANIKREWVDTVFYKLINYRYNKKLVTLFTSNAYLNELKFDGLVTSRINAMCYKIPMPELSIRDMLADRAKSQFWEKLHKGKGGSA